MEEVWETFDRLFRTVNRQDARVTDLEQRIAALEARLAAHQKPALTLVKNEEPEASRIA